MSQKLVSVIIPFYNRVSLLSEALKSVQQQTYENWEAILINDGSTGDISDIRTLVTQEPKFHLIEQENAGAAAARNAGIAQAKGYYVAFLDSDDLWEPDKLKKQIGYMEEQGYWVSHTSYIRFDDSGNRTQVNSGRLHGQLLPGLITNCPINTSSVVVEKKLLDEIPGPFRTQFQYGEDGCLYLSLAAKCEFGALTEYLTLTRVGETTATDDPAKVRQAIASILSYVKEDTYLSSYQKEIKELEQTICELERWQVQTSQGKRGFWGRFPRLFYLLRKSHQYLRDNGMRKTIRRVIGYLKGERGIWTTPKT